MSIILGILIVLAIIAGAAVALASAKPDSFRYERRIVINAPAEKIHPYLNDLHKSVLWSPWEKKDPAMKRTFTGPSAGPGATYEWDGNNQIGAGELVITESTPEKIAMRLEFFRPMKAVNTAEYTLAPSGEGTEVTWAMYGPNTLPGKCISLFIDCEKMVGKEFETGLRDLKALVEAS